MTKNDSGRKTGKPPKVNGATKPNDMPATKQPRNKHAKRNSR